MGLSEALVTSRMILVSKHLRNRGHLREKVPNTAHGKAIVLSRSLNADSMIFPKQDFVRIEDMYRYVPRVHNNSGMENCLNGG